MNLGLGCLWLFSVLGLGSSGNGNDAASVILGRGVSLEKMSKRKMVMVMSKVVMMRMPILMPAITKMPTERMAMGIVMTMMMMGR